MAEKQVTDWIPHHVHLFERAQFDPEYLKLNPKAQVPTLVHNGEIIRESSLICEYLDEVFPDPALKPGKLSLVSRMREWIKDVDESGFEGVASLSFVINFRAKLLAMSAEDREAYWAGQTVLERTQRQQSCVSEGLDSPYALRAIAAWERIFQSIDETVSVNHPWLMGEQFTLADLNFAPFVARLDGLRIVDSWLKSRPRARNWWHALKNRPSFIQAEVGPSAIELKTMEIEGDKIKNDFEVKRVEYLTQYVL